MLLVIFIYIYIYIFVNIYFFFRSLKAPSQIRWRLISIISAVMSVLSKETGIMAMAINISVAVVNYLIENRVSFGTTFIYKQSKNDFEKVGQNPITSKLRRKKQAVALKRIFTDILMVSFKRILKHVPLLLDFSFHWNNNVNNLSH